MGATHLEACAVSAPLNPNALPDDATLPDLPMSADEATELRDQIWAGLVGGRDDAEEFIEIYGEDYELSEAQLAAAFAHLREARLRQQAEIGDYHSRTAAAFDELNAHGVVARADFSCCGTCASAEIGAERDDTRHWIGYVYFHSQDTDHLIDSGTTYIGYGAFEPPDFDERAWKRLGKKAQAAAYFGDVARMLDDIVFPIVRRHGIEPEWNRDLATRVLLTDADWYAPIGI
jgi:hypothetical protein